MGQKSWSRKATLDRSARRRGLYDAVAARTGQLHTNMPDHLKARGDTLEHFRNVFPQLA